MKEAPVKGTPEEILDKVFLLCQSGDHAKVQDAVNQWCSDDTESELCIYDLLVDALLRSVTTGHLDAVKILLQVGANVNGLGKSLTKIALHIACELGHRQIAQCLLEANAEVNKQGPENKTALHLAVLNKHTNIMQLLLHYPVDLNLKTCNGQTAVDLALEQDNKDIVQLLLDKMDSDNLHRYKVKLIDFASHYGDMAFLQKYIPVELLTSHSQTDMNSVSHFSQMACLHNNTDAVTFLLNHDVNFGKRYRYTSAIHIACKSSSLELVKLILHTRSNKNVKDCKLQTPVFSAIENHRTDILKLLLQNDVSLDIKDKNGQTPFHFACAVGNAADVDLLLKQGTHVNAQNNKKNTALTLVLARSVHTTSQNCKRKDSCLSTFQQNHIVNALISLKADVNMKNRSGWTALHYAVYQSNTKAITILLAAGADVNAATLHRCQDILQGSTPLCTAILSNAPPNIIETLIQAEAKTDIQIGKSTNLLTPLTAAVTKNHATAVRLLLASGCDPETPIPNNNQNGGKQTLLQEAVLDGKPDIAIALLQAGANVNVLYEDNCSLLHKALYSVSYKLPIVKCLLQHGVDVNVVNNEAQTALHLFLKGSYHQKRRTHYIETQSDVRAAKAIITSPLTNLNAKNIVTGYTPLMTAVVYTPQNHRKVIINSLLKQGANINLRNIHGQTALHLAAHEGQLDSVVVLVENGCDVALRDKASNTALDIAVQFKHQNCAQYLLNKTDTSLRLGDLLLQRSAARQMRELFELLVQRGGSVNSSVTGTLHGSLNHDLRKYTDYCLNILSILLLNHDYKSMIPLLEAGFNIHLERKTKEKFRRKQLLCRHHGYVNQLQSFVKASSFENYETSRKNYGTISMLLLCSGDSPTKVTPLNIDLHTTLILVKSLPLMEYLLELGYHIDWEKMEPIYLRNELHLSQQQLALLQSQALARLEVLAARTVRTHLWPNAWVAACKLPLPPHLYNIHFARFFNQVKDTIENL